MLPAELCVREKAAQLEHVLRHELAHVRRRDAWGNLLMNFASPALYFHPLYWWIFLQIQFSRELIADDWAAGLSSKESYVGGLLQLLTPGRRMTFASMSVLGAFRLRSPFYRRMTLLIDRKANLATKASNRWKATYPFWHIVNWPEWRTVPSPSRPACLMERSTAFGAKGHVRQSDR